MRSFEGIFKAKEAELSPEASRSHPLQNVNAFRFSRRTANNNIEDL